MGDKLSGFKVKRVEEEKSVRAHTQHPVLSDGTEVSSAKTVTSLLNIPTVLAVVIFC
jgi:hypothetical protein